ncbi:unnamed protein product [Effrenium voratum]|nr:unnamed protein product [Effrenium voratum]
MQGLGFARHALNGVEQVLRGPCTRQVRWRQWLFPQATKGWRPERFEHEGEALRFARQSKRIPLWKLAWATSIDYEYLSLVEHGEARLGPEFRKESWSVCSGCR